MQNNRLGFKIVEDLGGGLRAVGTLENGFDVTNGTAMQGSRLFGRQAFVGLSSKQYGTFTLGRQYDMVWDYLDRFEASAAANGLATHVGDNDNGFATFRYNNSVKYATPDWNGFTAEALYAFSNEAGDFSANNAFSLGAGYARGPVQFGLAYVELHRPGTGVNPNGAVTNDYGGAPFMPFERSPLADDAGVDTQRITGIGGSYDFGETRINAMISDVRYSYLDGESLHLDNYDVSLTHNLTPALVLGAAYVYTKGSYGGGTGGDPKWHMAQLSIDYFLSKRTDIYLYGVAQRALGGAQADIWLFAPSTTNTQQMVLAGIRHKF
jgi:GBP family porin